MKWISTAAILAALGIGMSGSPAMAQQGSDPQNFDYLRARMDQQDAEIRHLHEELAAALGGTPATPAAYANPDGTMPAPVAADPVGQWPPGAAVVGSDMHVTASMKDGLFLWLETPNKDFTMHIGYWMQLDNVYWKESPDLKTAATARTGAPFGAISGPASGGIGELEDGEYFRRIRPFLEGTFWETGEYRLILALENDQYSDTGFDEFWVGETKIPVIGSCRIGHVKDPMGLEGDMTASSRCMTFMERSSYSEAIELNQNFLTGIWMSNNYLDEHVTWEFCAARPDQGASSGSYFGDGQSAVQGRITALPIYEDEGRQLLHFGVSAGWRDGATNGTIADHLFQLRARPELRDDDPAGSPSGGQALPNADSNRMVDTGAIAAKEEYLMGLEALYIRGPLSIQAEYGWNWIDGAYGIAYSKSAVTHFANGATEDYVFNGGYVQLAYTLTGENRAYDRRIGTLAREYYGHSGPYENAWLTRDADGNFIWGRGAWEIAARYSYVDLNSGSSPNNIQGGMMNGFTLGLNWYLNNNLNIMLDWVYDDRYDLPATETNAKGVVINPGTNPGHTNGLGIEVQFQL